MESRDVKVREAMKQVKNKIAVISGKGGVGKTTVAVNLACALSKKFSVGILDTDITGPNVPKMMGLDGISLESEGELIIAPEIDGIKVMSTAFLLDGPDTPVIWRGPLRGNIITQFLSDVRWGALDYLIIDLPPGTGDEALTVARMIPGISGAVIVTTPQDVALLDSRKAISFTRKVGLPALGVIENMSGFMCPHCKKDIRLFGHGGGKKAADDLGVPFIGRIPFDSGIVLAGDEGTPFMTDDTRKYFQEIAEKIIEGEKNG
jgi:ATP-binding protein involved in chromosome partitioning